MVIYLGIARKSYACISHHGRSMGIGHVMCRLIMDRDRGIFELAILVLGNFVYRRCWPRHFQCGVAPANQRGRYQWCIGRGSGWSNCLAGSCKVNLWRVDYRIHW